jgi:hypothetical protein
MKSLTIILGLIYSSIVLADGGISSTGGFAELLYYFLLGVVSVPLAIAFTIRKRRKFTNWLMLVLVAPSIVFAIASLFLSSVALYFATLKDIRMGVIFGIVGIAQILVIQRIYSSGRGRRHIET